MKDPSLLTVVRSTAKILETSWASQLKGFETISCVAYVAPSPAIFRAGYTDTLSVGFEAAGQHWVVPIGDRLTGSFSVGGVVGSPSFAAQPARASGQMGSPKS